MQKYKAIQGTLPRQWDIARWTEEHFRQYFDLVTSLMAPSSRGEQIIKCTTETLKAMEDRILNAPPSFQTELLYRLNQFTTDPDSTPRKFFYRLTALNRCVGNYVKKHPACLTDDLVEMIKDNPRLNWMTKFYTTYTTKTGAEVTVPDTKDTTTFQTQKSVKIEDPQTKLTNSMVHLADIFETLAKSLTKKELRSMKADQKIGALSKLSFIFGNKFKPNSQVFKQVNIYRSDVRDVERSLLDFNQENQ